MTTGETLNKQEWISPFSKNFLLADESRCPPRSIAKGV